MRKMAIILVLAFLAGGCPGPQPVNVSKPTAMVSPKVFAEGIEKLDMKMSQVQNTMQTTNFALDGERAKLERAAARDAQKSHQSMIGILVGVALLCFFMPAPISGAKRWIAVLIAFSIIVGSLVIPLIWPF